MKSLSSLSEAKKMELEMSILGRETNWSALGRQLNLNI